MDFTFGLERISPSITNKEENHYLMEIGSKLFKHKKKVLLIPPDITRFHSRAGYITNFFYKHFSNQRDFDILPAIGTHRPMTKNEIITMFGNEIPLDRFIKHDWRKDLKYCGEIAKAKISTCSNGLLNYSISVSINRQLELGNYDLILSIGQLVPHEIVGIANYTKNILIGVGGEDIIHKTHFLGAVYGMEQIMGRINTPVREVLDYGFQQHLSHLPIQFLYTIIKLEKQGLNLKGLFCGKGYDTFKQAAKLSQQCNLTLLDEPIRKAVVYLQPQKFKSTWLANKAIYRLRMAMASGGELFILSPGLKQFGEDPIIDNLIRTHGYKGRQAIMEDLQKSNTLRANLSAAAHLIHGSSEAKFNITYCPGNAISEAVIRQVGFNYMPFDKAVNTFNLASLRDGHNQVKGEGDIFYVSNPALGLWALRKQFNNLMHNL